MNPALPQRCRFWRSVAPTAISFRWRSICRNRASSASIFRRGRSRHADHPLERHVKLRPKGLAIDRRSEPRERATEKQRLTVQLAGGVLDRLRNAVFWTPGLTITGFIERCISETVDPMEKERGDEFPERSHHLKAGRPPR